ncbi:hypothetical protein ACT691_08875 [Vibrio metschnikovii]
MTTHCTQCCRCKVFLPAHGQRDGMSLFNFGRELGGALGVAFCSALFFLRVPKT